MARVGEDLSQHVSSSMLNGLVSKAQADIVRSLLATVDASNDNKERHIVGKYGTLEAAKNVSGWNRNAELLRVLLDARLTPIANNFSELQIAVRLRDLGMVRLLLDAGADPAQGWPTGLRCEPSLDSPLLQVFNRHDFVLFELLWME